MLDLEYGFISQYARVQPKPGKLPADLAEELDRLERRLAELEDIDGDQFTDELTEEAARREDRRAEIEEIAEGLAVFSKKDRRRAGCIVTIGNDGEFCLHQGLLDRSTMRNDNADTGDADGLAGDEFDDGINDEFDPDMSSDGEEQRSYAGAEQALRKELGLTQRLVDDLKAHRLQITRAHLAGNFEVAFDLALYTLCLDLFERFGYRTRSLDMRTIEAMPRSSLNDLTGTVADRLLDAGRKTLDLQWLSLPPAEGFAALTALPMETKQRLFAWCIASCLKPQLSIEDRADPVLEAAGQRLAIPFADYWRPTAANYWGRVKKAHSLAIGAEILGERWARDHADDKKATLAAALEIAFDPARNDACIALGQTARDSAAAWMPTGMTYDGGGTSHGASINFDGAARGDADGGEEGDLGAAADLAAFLTEDEPAGTPLNCARCILTLMFVTEIAHRRSRSPLFLLPPINFETTGRRQ